MNTIKEGLRKLPVHFFGFGVPIGLAVYFGGWSGVFVLIAWRAYAEYLDYREKRDTAGKALLDFVSQVSGAVIAGFLR